MEPIQQRARTAAAAAAERAGVVVRTLHLLDELDEARTIMDLTWPLDIGGTNLEPNLARALEHSGSYFAGAFAPDGAMVGMVMGVLGRHRDVDGAWEMELHSHVAAVVPTWQDRHVGTALKSHQRAWALAHDIPVVVWTFDPLVRRNARLNLLKLGAGVHEYLPDFYGPMNDSINAGDRTDRLLAWWQVGSARAEAAADGRLAAYTDVPPGAIVVPLPDDIVAIRRSDPAEALRWRMTVRETLQTALAAGFVVDGVTVEGSYVLLPDPGSTVLEEDR